MKFASFLVLTLSLFSRLGFSVEDKLPPSLKEALEPLGIKMNAPEKFIVQNLKHLDSADRHRTNIWATDGQNFLELHLVEPVSKTDSDALIFSEQIIAARLYQPRRTPYSDQISNVKGCQKEYLPLKRDISIFGLKEKALLATANKTRTFGICQKSEIAYIGASLGSYDANKKRLLKISYYLKASGELPESMAAKISSALEEMFPK